MKWKIIILMCLLVVVAGCSTFNKCEVGIPDGDWTYTYGGKFARTGNKTCCVIGGYTGDVNKVKNQIVFCHPQEWRILNPPTE